jgi:hypothetical protein
MGFLPVFCDRNIGGGDSGIFHYSERGSEACPEKYPPEPSGRMFSNESGTGKGTTGNGTAK